MLKFCSIKFFEHFELLAEQIANCFWSRAFLVGIGFFRISPLASELKLVKSQNYESKYVPNLIISQIVN